MCRCSALDVDQFQPVTAAATARTSRLDDEASIDHEVSVVTELNDETGQFEYTLYSLTASPYIRLYVPGLMMISFKYHINIQT